MSISYDSRSFSGYEEERYRFDAAPPIGRGAQGAVYKAFDRLDRRDVAIKVLERSDDATSTEVRDGLWEEVRNVRRIADRGHIVDVFDIRKIEGHVAIVMELMDEGLDRHMTDPAAPKHGRWSLRALGPHAVVDLGSQIFDGLAAAHSAPHGPVIHRDIKPGNILIRNPTDACAGIVVKLADFGVSRCLEGMAEARSFVGTIAYMAPEILQHHSADARADIYSAGVTLYEMATGVRPFGTPRPPARRVIAGQYTPIEKTCPGLPRELCAIIRRAMHCVREERYQQADDVAAALRACLHDLPAGALQATRALPAAEAIRALQALIEQHPDALAPRMELGDRHLKTGAYAAARAAYEQALERRPGSGRAHYRLGLVFHSQRRLQRARESFEQALAGADLTEQERSECQRKLSIVSRETS